MSTGRTRSITVSAATPWHGQCIGCPRCHERAFMRDDHFQRFYCVGCGLLVNDEDPIPDFTAETA
jgi:hypothetical protein